ncbi:hypothetical protein JXA05_04055 [Candidatus Peregrinibacteria bacterium]|nr:hypothetical protein [Candidatus Peregrinibacteria bacterium]
MTRFPAFRKTIAVSTLIVMLVSGIAPSYAHIIFQIDNYEEVPSKGLWIDSDNTTNTPNIKFGGTATAPTLTYDELGSRMQLNKNLETSGPAAINGAENAVTDGSSQTVTTANDAFEPVQIGAKLVANGETRYVIAKASDTEVTVDIAVDWDNGDVGYSFTYKNPILKLFDESANKMTVRSDGWTGIGMESPFFPMALTNLEIDTDANGDEDGGGIMLGAEDEANVYVGLATYDKDGTILKWTIGNYSDSTVATPNGLNIIEYSDSGDNGLGGGSGVSRLYIDGSSGATAGYVGIGTTAPGATLDVRGGAVFNEESADADFRIEGDGDADLFVVDAGTDKVGIGDLSPEHKLDVDGNIGLTAGGYINMGDTDGEGGYGFRDNAGDMQFKDDAGIWTNFSAFALPTLDDAYDNEPGDDVERTITVDDGDVSWDLANGATDYDFVIDIQGDASQIRAQDGGADFITVSADRTVDYTTDETATNAIQVTGNALTTGDLVQLSATNTGTGDVLQITGGATAGADNFAINVTAGDVYIADDTLIGANAQTIASGFTVDGDDLFVAGMIGAEGAIYTDDDLMLQTDVDTTGAGNITINFGGTNTETLIWNATDDVFELSDDLLPDPNDTYDLGSIDKRWQNLFLGPDSLHIGTNATDEGTISYNTNDNILKVDTDGTTQGDIAFNTDDLYIDTSESRVGIGTNAPTTPLETAKNDATADAIVDMVTITKETSEASANGIGLGMIFKIEDGGDTEEQASIDVFLDDVTNTEEDATMAFNINRNGTITEMMRLDGTLGHVGIGETAPVALVEIGDNSWTRADENVYTVEDGGTTVTTSNNAFTDVQVGAVLNANNETRIVVAKSDNETITVDSAVDWYFGGSGYIFDFKNPRFKTESKEYTANYTSDIIMAGDGSLNVGYDIVGDNGEKIATGSNINIKSGTHMNSAVGTRGKAIIEDGATTAYAVGSWGELNHATTSESAGLGDVGLYVGIGAGGKVVPTVNDFGDINQLFGTYGNVALDNVSITGANGNVEEAIGAGGNISFIDSSGITVTTAIGAKGDINIDSSASNIDITTAIGLSAGPIDLAGDSNNNSIGTAYGLYVDEFSKTGTNTLDNAYGMYVKNMTEGDDSNVGLLIEGASGGTSLNTAIYSASGDNFFSGNVGIGLDILPVGWGGDAETIDANLHVQKETTSTNNNVAIFEIERTDSPTDYDNINTLFKLTNDNSDIETYAEMTIFASDVSDGTEEGIMQFHLANGIDGTLNDVFTISQSTNFPAMTINREMDTASSISDFVNYEYQYLHDSTDPSDNYGINFNYKLSNDNATAGVYDLENFARMRIVASDVSDGTEGGEMIFSVADGATGSGVLNEAIRIYKTGNTATNGGPHVTIGTDNTGSGGTSDLKLGVISNDSTRDGIQIKNTYSGSDPTLRFNNSSDVNDWSIGMDSSADEFFIGQGSYPLNYPALGFNNNGSNLEVYPPSSAEDLGTSSHYWQDVYAVQYYGGTTPTVGLNTTITVRKGDDSGSCTITVSGGIITATTC